MERHFTDHGNPHAHSNPHDHKISWNEENGNPIISPPINYWNEPIKEIKNYKELNVMKDIDKMNALYEHNKFETIDEFKWEVKCGSEINFLYNEQEYFISGCLDPKRPFFCVIGRDDKDIYFDNIEKLLDHVIDGKKLREIIKVIKVIDRTF